LASLSVFFFNFLCDILISEGLAAFDVALIVRLLPGLISDFLVKVAKRIPEFYFQEPLVKIGINVPHRLFLNTLHHRALDRLGIQFKVS
jgi:hypothetical protein